MRWKDLAASSTLARAPAMRARTSWPSRTARVSPARTTEPTSTGRFRMVPAIRVASWASFWATTVPGKVRRLPVWWDSLTVTAAGVSGRGTAPGSSVAQAPARRDIKTIIGFFMVLVLRLQRLSSGVCVAATNCSRATARW